MKIFTKVLVLFSLLAISITSFAGPGDTLVVQTYTFDAQNNPETAYDSPGKRWFQMPADDGTTYQKVLMQYKLKCFEDGTAGGLGYSCGEWDYTSHTFLYEHTGSLDSNYASHPFYLLNNQDFDTASVVSEPYNNYLSEHLYMSEIVSTNSETISTSNIGTNNQSFPFGNNSFTVRSQYLFTADELNAIGVVAGDIDALQMDLFSIDSSLHLIKVRMKETALSGLTSFENDDFSDHYYWNYSFDTAGTNTFWFANSFTWDGSSNIIIELTSESTDGDNSTEVVGGNTGFESTVVSHGHDGYLEVNENDEIKVPVEVFETIDEQVTISFWIFGDEDILPTNTYMFEGRNSSNNRVLNAHLPWSNSRVYWDAGYDGGYDRIDKLANINDFSGKWNHWSFTKNTVSETMKIYLNGSLWHSGTGMNNSMAEIVEFSIAKAVTGSGFFFGMIDEFQIWDTELDAATINEWLYKDVDASHPMYSNLRAYYQFNSNNGEPIYDSSPYLAHAQANGSPNRVKYRADELFRNITASDERPNIGFVSGDYISSVINDTQLIEVPVPPVSLTSWEVVGNAVEMTNLAYYWPEGNSTIFDEDGNVVDETFIQADSIFTNSEINYYETPFEVVNKWEMGRFITPYGIQLDLEDGWTWEYDVSDFITLLHDSIELEAGNWQELLDLKFLFIEGTPPRDVKRIEQPWHGNWNLATWQDDVLEKSYTLNGDEQMAKINVTTSGHWFGQGANCAEFCNNIHNVAINGQEEYSWQIMQECADNPLYPQGGTWIYDRAGWCPGAPVTRREFDLTSFIVNNELNVDYNVTSDPYGNYWLTGHLVFYGEHNFANDVELNDILSPSLDKVKSRMNPVCNQPLIRIRNNGSEPLTSCTISYGLEGQMEIYEWTGNLGFLETEDVSLVFSNEAMWIGNEDEVLTFRVEVTQPNGVADDNEFNNAGTSSFYQPVIHAYSDLDDNRLIINFKTNNAYYESDYTLKDINENLVFQPEDFTEGLNTYRDTIYLAQGCYHFHATDSGDDGLSFFANNDGNGYIKFKRVGGSNFISLERNFGKEIEHYFYWMTDVVSVDEEEISNFNVDIFPIPARNTINIELEGFASDIDIEILNLDGQLVYSSSYINYGKAVMKPIDVQNLASGMYFVFVDDGRLNVKKKFVIEK